MYLGSCAGSQFGSWVVTRAIFNRFFFFGLPNFYGVRVDRVLVVALCVILAGPIAGLDRYAMHKSRTVPVTYLPTYLL
jgi:hypothetical protein